MIPAAIPFFELPVWNLPVPGFGAIPIDPWATLVCIGFVVGLEVVQSLLIALVFMGITYALFFLFELFLLAGAAVGASG